MNKSSVEIKKIGYLKTHKCASTSVQNILLRYAQRHNLNVVVPMVAGNIFGYDKLFNRKFIQTLAWKKDPISYSMFLCHARWNHTEVSFVLNDTGKSDVFYFSFLRDPVELFCSYWDYNGFQREFGALTEFISKNISKALKSNKSYIWTHGGYNQMLYDFGLQYNDMNDTKKVKLKIKEIHKNFDLLLLADQEFFEDSLILLKNSIHWDYNDMINFKLNARSVYDKSKITREDRKILKGKELKTMN